MDLIQGADELPEPPVDLGVRGVELWRGVLADHELRVDELRVLEDACREVDLIERLEEGLRGAALVVTGSQGQPVANPIVQELRQHRGLVARLLGLLKLPDEEQAGRDAQWRTQRARKAALTRWNGA
ncbi:hypothetical protein ABZT02_09610 [Streptomyces sp. NPDC005402]|uniref:hypothetical protein n=1 Tax=Streptomyces sp. NPDC005402 TaxID=3155338 RepID=UPI0033BB2EE3